MLDIRVSDVEIHLGTEIDVSINRFSIFYQPLFPSFSKIVLIPLNSCSLGPNFHHFLLIFQPPPQLKFLKNSEICRLL